MQGVAGASRQTRIQALFIFSMAPVFFFSRQRPLPLPFFAFPYHSNLEVLLQGRLLACPGTGRAVSFASGVFRAAAGGQEKIPNFEKIITDAIAFPPPMTHNGVWFSGNKSKAPCQTSSRYWFLPAGGIPGGFHHGAPKQEAETAPTCRVISQCDARERKQTAPCRRSLLARVQTKCPGVGCF